MEYNNLKTLVDVKVKNFVNEYKETSVLFENTDVKNGLIHPGEFGVYKEKLIAKLFRFALPKRFSCGTGFIVNSKKEITTQCDIVLYDENSAPFLEIDGGNRFFPQEVVYGVGEVKSKLTKQQLLDAMIKLAKNKRIRHPFINYDNERIDPAKNQYQAIFTFLICDEIIGWDKDIALEIQKEYRKYSISSSCWFNIILSLKNGVIAYNTKRAIDLLKYSGISIDDELKSNNGNRYIAIPCFGDPEKNFCPLDFYTICLNNEVEHVKEFLVLVNEVLIHCHSYYPDPKYYLYG
ncbi:MAG: DUF6602 domain-containing protein [Clostridium sp.]|nr:DUF6602 domain-containing protein [Clostridium sp.]